MWNSIVSIPDHFPFHLLFIKCSMQIYLKVKDLKYAIEFCLKVFAKVNILKTNCMEIGYLLSKILRFYVFKMAASGGRNFEINMKVQNYETQFIYKKTCVHIHF